MSGRRTQRLNASYSGRARTILLSVAKNVALFYGIYIGVTFGSVFLLLGGFEAVAGSGLFDRILQIVAFLALPSIASSIAALVMLRPRARSARVLVSAIAAGSAYVALAAVGVSVAAPGTEDLLSSPLYFTNMAAILSGLLFGALARPAGARAAAEKQAWPKSP